jgi:glutamine synthetase
MADQAAGEHNTDAIKSDAKEAAEKFDYVRFTFTDTHGVARSKTVPRRNFDEFFESGITIYVGWCLL